MKTEFLEEVNSERDMKFSSEAAAGQPSTSVEATGCIVISKV